MTIAPGQVLASRFRADVLLGRGGMGEVWRCFDLEEKRHVAIKTVLAKHVSAPWVRRLLHSEVIAVARLGHPGIVEIYDLLEDEEGCALLVMAFRPGVSLERALPAVPTWAQIRSVLVQLLEALAHAHARSVLHLDIKPANVLVDTSGGAPRVTLVDFGIARVKRPGRGAESWFDKASVLGTLEYMAPEQFRGQLAKFGPWTDLYSIGLIAYELCHGGMPFEASDPLDAARIRATTPAPPLVPRGVSIPVGFRDLAARLLAISPSQRPTCAADVLAELERIDLDELAMPPSSALGRRASVDAETADMPIETVIPETVSASTSGSRAPVSSAAPTCSLEDASGGTGPVSAGVRVTPPSTRRVRADAEVLFTAEASAPTPGAYGLFGLRELPVLGRVEERRALWNAIGNTTIGRPDGAATGAVILAGPAGTGKSRLARDAAERALELGLANVLTTHWSVGGSPDEGLRGLVENALESRGSRDADFEARLAFWLERMGARDATAFERELRVLLRPAPDAAPDADLPMRAACELVVRASRVRPVLLWLDDVQWSRREATALMDALSEVEPAPNVCVLVTVREDELAERREHDAFVESLERLTRGGDDPDALVLQVPMLPLDTAATRTLLRGLLDLEDDLAEAIARRAEGNPLFVAQLVGQLVGERAVERRTSAEGRGRYVLTRARSMEEMLPADIGAVWARRVKLSGASEADLQLLALVRERVSGEVLDALANDAGSTFERSLERALDAGLVRRDGGLYAFEHGLLRDSLLHAIPAADKPSMHAAAARALAPLVGKEDVQEERARHLAESGSLDAASAAMLDAAMWSFRRAERDARRARLEALVSWTDRTSDATTRARALGELAQLEIETGAVDAANATLRSALEAASRVESRATLAWLAFRESQVMRLQGRSAEGSAASERAVAHARAANEAEVEAFALGQLALDAVRGDRPDAGALAARAFDAAKRSGNRATEAHLLVCVSDFADGASSVASLARIVDVCRAAGALRTELMARQVRLALLWDVGEHDLARREAIEVSADAQRKRMRQTVSLVEMQSAIWASRRRDWDTMASHTDRAREWGAGSGAKPERAYLAAFDVVLGAAHGAVPGDAVERLLSDGEGFREPDFIGLVTLARELAPSDLESRLASLCG